MLKSNNKHPAIMLGAAAAAIAAGTAQAATDHILYSFAGGNDGASPRATLIMDSAGNLYGTTNKGGAAGAGTVFKVTPGGVETVLYTFTGGADGGNPAGGPLVMDSTGTLYGTTALGGARGAGTIFKLPPGGPETVLWSFTDGADGGYPSAGLIADAQGNLYGTCFDGGSAGGWGTVFEYTTSNILSVLHPFANTAGDGGRPESTLAFDSSGNLYGTTYNTGTVFKVVPGGATTTLHLFTNGSDGSSPQGGVVLDSAGNVYGTAGGGTGYGVFYEITAGGTFSVLHNGPVGRRNVALVSNPVIDSSGNFYGATYSNGPMGDGSVYELSSHSTPHGTVWRQISLHAFLGSPDGANAIGSVVADSAGNLYGVTEAGGSSGNGAVYKIPH